MHSGGDLWHISMSRTNHYRICEGHEHNRVFQGECWYCDGWFDPPIRYGAAQEILGRRNWKRKSRYPKHSVKSYHNGPPRWWWQEQHGRARAIYRQMMERSDDPALPREKDLINLWDWY